MGDLTSRIVAQATATPTDAAQDVMRLSVLDWIACGIAGREEPVSRCVDTMLDGEAGAPQTTGFDGTRRPARATALYNGTASHALDYDDTHFAHIGHVSVGVLPAALAVAERQDASIAQFLAAGLAGSEAAIRMGLALGRDHYQGGFHQTATAGTFGATLAASLLLTTDLTTIEHALGLASTQAAGLKSQFGTMGKPYNAGLAASAGVQAALLAAAGMDSNPDGWDGPGGFIATHMGQGDIAPDGFLMPMVSHKFHACCHGLHATLEALATLLPVDPDSIRRVQIATHPRWMSVCNQAAPTTGLGAKFSYRAVTAMAIIGLDTARPDSFAESTMARDDLRDLMEKVSVTGDATLSERQAQVTVTTADGAQDAAHDLDQPLPLDQRNVRVRAKAGQLIGTDAADRIWAMLTQGPDLPVADLTRTFVYVRK